MFRRAVLFVLVSSLVWISSGCSDAPNPPGKFRFYDKEVTDSLLVEADEGWLYTVYTDVSDENVKKELGSYVDPDWQVVHYPDFFEYDYRNGDEGLNIRVEWATHGRGSKVRYYYQPKAFEGLAPQIDALYTRTRFEFGDSKDWNATKKLILDQLPKTLYVCDEKASGDKFLVIYGAESAPLVGWFKNSPADFGFTEHKEKSLSKSKWKASLKKFVKSSVAKKLDLRPRHPAAEALRVMLEISSDEAMDLVEDLYSEETQVDLVPALLSFGLRAKDLEIRRNVALLLSSSDVFLRDVSEGLHELIDADWEDKDTAFKSHAKKLPTKARQRFVRHYLDHSSVDLRCLAIFQYQKHLPKTKASVEELRPGLQAKEERVRERTVFALREHGALAKPLLPEIRKLKESTDDELFLETIEETVTAISGEK